MEVVLDALSARMPWTVARPMLRSKGLNPGVGWTKTIEKMRSATGDDTQKYGLVGVLRGHILCGEKFTKIYPLSNDERNTLSDAISNYVIDPTLYAGEYPFYISADEIEKIEGKLIPISIESNDDGIGLVFTSGIKLTVKEPLEFEEFNDAEELRKRYDEVVGLKYKHVQVFNVLWVPHDRNVAEIRTDYPAGMPQEVLHAIHSQMRKVANELSSAHLDESCDLFSLIEKIYENPQEGIVVELGFATTTGSLKNEKMRRQKDCLRNEKYHLSGKAGLQTKIEPFKLSVQWYIDFLDSPVTPELTLAGTSKGRRKSGSTGPLISGAVVANCLGVADYEYVMAVIWKYLAPEQLQKNKDSSGLPETVLA